MLSRVGRKLIAVTIIIVVTLAFVFAMNFSFNQRELSERQAKEYLTESVNYTRDALQMELKRQSELLDIVAKNAHRYNGDRERMIQILDTIANTGEFSRVGITYKDQKTLLCYGEEVDLRDREYYKRALQGETVIAAPIVSRVSGQKVIILAKPFYQNNKIAGMAHQSFSMESAGVPLLGAFSNSKSRITMIINYQGDIIMGVNVKNHKNAYEFAQENVLGSAKTEEEIREIIADRKSETFHYTDTFGETQHAVFVPLDINNWYMVQIVADTTVCSDQNMLNKIAHDTMLKYFFFVVMCLIFIVYIWRNIEKSHLEQVHAKIEGIHLTAGLTEGCMFEYDLDMREFLFVKDVVNGNKVKESDRQALQKLGKMLAEVFVKNNNAALSEYFHESDLGIVANALNEIKKTGKGVFQGRLFIEYAYNWYRIYMTVVFDNKQNAQRILGNIIDVNETQEKFVAIQQQSERDYLTGVYNRIVFEKKAEEILENEFERNHAFILLNINNFKNINERKGHAFGDAVLCQTAGYLTTSFRSTDILGRLDGDEFGILMCDIDSCEAVLARVDKICNLYKQSETIEDVDVSCSIGIVFAKQSSGESLSQLYSKADIALNRAKSQGKNVAVLFSEG